MPLWAIQRRTGSRAETTRRGPRFAWPDRDEAGSAGRPAQQAARARLTVRRRVRAKAPASLQGRLKSPAPRAVTPLGASEAETGARRIARAANSLQELEAALQNFDGCGLKSTATKLCFYRGAPNSDLMVIGEAPGPR